MSPLALLPVAASVHSQASPETQACGPRGERSWLCSTVFRVTENQRASEIVDAFAKPLRIVLILLAAWFATYLVNRIIRRILSTPPKRKPKSDTAKKSPFGFIDTGGVQSARRAQRAKTMADVLGRLANAVIWGIAVLVVLG